jgi:light-regulated signal transduction histidine kinase (bacteriophytochrome)
VDDTAEKRIQELEQGLQAAREELRFFVYAAGHDLQQSLRAVTTHAQLLRRECPDSERAREITDVIVAGAAQMNTLVTALVAYSRLTGAPDRRYVPLSVPLDYALYKLSGAIRDAGAEVHKAELPETAADENQMATVFEHLISNSLKFRGTKPPRVEISSEASDDFHAISVRDNGCGIRPEYHEQVFLPFKRLHGREIPGTGLGLALCRKIVRAHEGRIWVESDGASGTTVRFTLPQ